MVSCNISVYTILFKTAYQALLLILYHYYGFPVNYLVMVQLYTYSSTCGSDSWSDSKHKHRRQKKECSEYFFNTKTQVCRRFDFRLKKLTKITNGKIVPGNVGLGPSKTLNIHNFQRILYTNMYILSRKAWRYSTVAHVPSKM